MSANPWCRVSDNKSVDKIGISAKFRFIIIHHGEDKEWGCRAGLVSRPHLPDGGRVEFCLGVGLATLVHSRKAMACSRPLDPKSTQSRVHRESEEFFQLTGQLAQPNQDSVFSTRAAFFNGHEKRLDTSWPRLRYLGLTSTSFLLSPLSLAAARNPHAHRIFALSLSHHILAPHTGA